VSGSNPAGGASALDDDSDRGFNAAVGADARINKDSSGNATANTNTAVGSSALKDNVNGGLNTALGADALLNNDSSGNGTANANTAVGSSALIDNVDGADNTAVGEDALLVATGSQNTALGRQAGLNQTTGSSNIYIGDAGAQGESHVIAIGDRPPTGFSYAACFIGGIAGRGVGASNDIVRINTLTGQLGTVVPSSARFKKDIKPMNNASEPILLLKPVTFHYKEDKTNTLQFGLVAEEVAKVDPSLVVLDQEGKPLSVRYDDINMRLLNEFLKEHKAFVAEQHKVQELEANAAQQQKQIEALTASLQKVSAQVELNKSAPQTVLNNH